MSFVTRLWRSIENPSFPLSQAGDEWGIDARSHSGVSVTRESALTFSPVWRGVFLIANAVAKLPLFTYERDADGEGKHYADRHAAYPLLRRKPNREMTSFVFRQRMQAVAILEGNAYAHITRGGNAYPTELIPLPAGSCCPVRVDGVLWYVYTPERGAPVKLMARDVLHIKGPGLDAMEGYRLYEKAKNSLGSGMAAEEYSGRFFRNGAEPRVVFESDDDVDDVQAMGIKATWDAMHSGLENSHRTAILKNGLKIKSFGIDPEKAQLIETRKFSPTNVANWLQLPVHLVGGEGRTAYASLEQENLSFLEHSLDPHLVNWEEECYDKLLTEEEKAAESHTIEFMRQALMRADAAGRAGFYHNMLQDGVMNRDEVRARENLGPIPAGEGKKYFVPLNLGIAGQGQTDADAKFKRDAWLGFQKDGTVADVAANLTDIKALTKDVGLPVNEEYTEPYLPVTADAGPMVSGGVVEDEQGDIVGGDVLESVPAVPATEPPAGAGAVPVEPVEGEDKPDDVVKEPAEGEGGGAKGEEKEGTRAHDPMVAVRAATRKVLAETARRMARRLTKHAEKHVRDGTITAFVNVEMPVHRTLIAEAFTHAAEAHVAAGGTADAAGLADALCRMLADGLAAPEPEAFVAAFEARSIGVVESK